MSGYQRYDLITATPVSLWKCEGCGTVVADTDKHDYWHDKTRSIV